jgi:hypothetical protein
LTCASTRGGTGPAFSPNALSLVQVQRHRLLGHRRPQPLDLGPRTRQRRLLGRLPRTTRHLDVGGVHVDRRIRRDENGTSSRWHQRQRDSQQPGRRRLQPSQLLGPEPLRQTRRGRGRHRRHSRQPLPGSVGTLMDQGDQPVPAQQLALRQRHQQLPRGHTTIPLLDRADMLVEHLDHAQPVDQLRQRGPPRPTRSATRSACPPGHASYPAHDCVIWPPRRCLSREVFEGFDNLDLPYWTGTFAIHHADHARTTCGSGSDQHTAARDSSNLTDTRPFVTPPTRMMT